MIREIGSQGKEPSPTEQMYTPFQAVRGVRTNIFVIGCQRQNFLSTNKIAYFS